MKLEPLHAKTSKNALDTTNQYSWIPDMPPGPLDKYRKRCRFNWKVFQTTLEDPEYLKIKHKIWNALKKEKDFQDTLTTPTVEEQKRRTMRQLIRFQILKYDFITPEILNSSYIRKTKHLMALNEALCVFNKNISVKFGLGVTLFGNTIALLGSDRHHKYCDQAWHGEIFGSFAITEFAHGSNTKEFRTTATYDPKTKEFVIHTPDFEAAKCWVGNLGRTCTYALVFSQLITADGENHGLHGFIVPIRDPKTLLPYPGVVVGDIGEKNGINGVDNGFVMFNNYRIPKDCLLNRTGDIGEDGSYETSFTNPQQIFGAALEAFTMGRIAVCQEATITFCCAMTIAVRYAAVRRQFGEHNNETPILEYPLHQWRLFPYLAAAVLFRIFIQDFVDQYLKILESSSSSNLKHSEFSALAGEIHALVSSGKPLITWICRDALQECREACGGHGYLKASKLGEYRTDHDPSVTYEGDNNVLIQQTSNWLLRQSSTDKNEFRNSPINSTPFLDRFDSVLNFKFLGKKESDVVNPDFITCAFEWLLCWLIRETDNEISSLQSQGVGKFNARAKAQVYKARILSLAYAENNVLIYSWRRINRPGINPDVRIILTKLHLIFGLWCIDRHLSYFYQGGFAEGSNLANLVREGLLSLCRDIVADSVGVADALAPPDYALNSVLGYSDGNLYENLKNRILNQPGATERAYWWKDAIPPAISKL